MIVVKQYCWALVMWFCVVLGQGLSVEAWATTMYSYIDEQGNLVYTDTLETVPQKYRAKVKAREQPDAVTSRLQHCSRYKKKSKHRPRILVRGCLR